MNSQKDILWIATANEGKAKEFELLLKDHRLYFLKDLTNYKSPEETGRSFKENAKIKAHALKKAHFADWERGEAPKRLSGRGNTAKTSNPRIRIKQKHWILGEDSGLEAPALGNAPGVYSARYAALYRTTTGAFFPAFNRKNQPREKSPAQNSRPVSAQTSDEDNLKLLLENMKPFSGKDRAARFVSHIAVLSPSGKEYSFEGRVEGSIAHKPRGKTGFGYDPVFIPKGETRSLAQLGLEYKNRFSHRARAVEKMKKHLFSKTSRP